MSPTEPDDERSDVVVLIDEAGEETSWAFLGEVEAGGQPYAVLTALAQLEGEGDEPIDVVLRRYVVDDDGWESFLPIEDDAERAQVEAAAAAFLEAEGLLPA